MIGVIETLHADRGERVRKGQVLATLDDRDLKLERVRWESELEVALRKERDGKS